MTRSMSSTTGSFIHVCAEVPPSPWAIATDWITASAERSLTMPVPVIREMNGSTIAMSPRAARESTAPVLTSARVAAQPSAPHSSAPESRKNPSIAPEKAQLISG